MQQISDICAPRILLRPPNDYPLTVNLNYKGTWIFNRELIIFIGFKLENYGWTKNVVREEKLRKTVIIIEKKETKSYWQRWDSNPRLERLVPKTSALDHSATLPIFNSDVIVYLKYMYT